MASRAWKIDKSTLSSRLTSESGGSEAGARELSVHHTLQCITMQFHKNLGQSYVATHALCGHESFGGRVIRVAQQAKHVEKTREAISSYYQFVDEGSKETCEI